MPKSWLENRYSRRDRLEIYVALNSSERSLTEITCELWVGKVTISGRKIIRFSTEICKSMLEGKRI